MPLFGPPNVEKMKAKGDVKGLFKLLTSKKGNLSQQAGQALVEIGAPVVTPLLTAMSKIIGDQHPIAEFVDVMASIGSPAVGPLVAALLTSGDRTCYLIILALGAIGDAESVVALQAATSHENILVRLLADSFAKDPAGARVRIPLIVGLQKTYSMVSGASVAIMNSLDPIVSIVAMTGGDKVTKPLLAGALGIIGDPRAVPQLIADLTYKDPIVCQSAALALGLLGDPRALAPLTERLKDGDAGVRRSATLALAAIRNESTTKSLATALKDEEADVRQAADKALPKQRAKPSFADTKTFFGEEWNLSITYPADWEIIYQDEPAGSWTIPIAVAGADIGGGRPCFMVNARRGEILQGSDNLSVFGMGPNGISIKMPATPGEYIEMNRESLRREFPGFQFISAEEIRLVHKPAARLVYSYSGQKGRITEESITLFGVGITFQFICEVPSAHYAEFQPRFQSILESFRIGRETPEEAVVAEGDSEETLAEQSPAQIYNIGVHYYRNGDFEEALEAFDRCFRSGEYQMQAGYARVLCQQELGLEVEIPEELGENAEAAGPVYIASNLACCLIGKGYQAALTKQGRTSEVRANINGALYLVIITSGFGFGGFFNNAWRKEGEKSIPLTDSSANPNPTEADQFVISLVKQAVSLPPQPLPEGGLRTSLEQAVLPVPDGEQQQAEVVQPVDSDQLVVQEPYVEAEGELEEIIAAEALHTLEAKPADEARRHLEQAYNYESSDEFEQALRECEAAIQLAPDWAEAHNLRGVVLESSGRKAEALAAYREAVRLNPAFDEAQENLQEMETERRRQGAKQLSEGSASRNVLVWAAAIAYLFLVVLVFFAPEVSVTVGFLMIVSPFLYMAWYRGQSKEGTEQGCMIVGGLFVGGLILLGLVLLFQPEAFEAVMDTSLAGQTGGTAVRPMATVSVRQVVVTAIIDVSQATATAQWPQAETTAQATQATAVASSGWPLVVLDTFDTNEHNWPTGDGPGELATVTRSFIDGKYRWKAEAYQGVHSSAWLGTSAVTDFYLSAEIQRISGPDDGSYGVEFRMGDNNNRYYFGIYNSQHCGFSLLYEGQWTRLIDLTPISAIRADEVNRITVIAEGPHFVFLINDQFVAEADDDRLDSGTVGLAIGLNNAGDRAVFEFDNLELRAPSTSASMEATTPTPSSVGAGQIAFASARDGNWEIYVMDADGSNPRNLTNDSAGDVYPTWSPDGSQIAFMSDRDGDGEIYVMDADGNNLRNLTNNSVGDAYPAWSPGGSQIAFQSERDGNIEIYVMSADGNNSRRLTNHSASDGYPAWSPDGSQIAFTTNRDGNLEIYVMDAADGNNLRNLTNNSVGDAYSAWSPDGSQIAFTTNRDGNEEIYVMDAADGNNLRNLTNNSADDAYPAWSPDGSQIAFLSVRDGNEEIYVMDADGSNLRNLTNNSVQDRLPVWQPGGTGAGTGILTPTPAATAPPPGGGATQPSPGVPGKAIVLSEDLRIEGIPQSVIPYGSGQSVTLVDLRLKQDDDRITGEVHYTRNQPGEFTLVVYVTMPEQLLIAYFDPAQYQILVTPQRSSGNVLWGLQGYELQGGADEGTIEFSFPSYAHGVYDITGMEGRVFGNCSRSGLVGAIPRTGRDNRSQRWHLIGL